MTNEKFQEMEHEHLVLLTSLGIHYTSILLTTSKLLHKNDINSEEREELLNILLEAARKHSELIEWSLKERQNSISPNEVNTKEL